MSQLPAIHLVAPSWDGRRTAAIGTGAFDDAESGAAFLTEACVALRGQGYQAVLGPMDGSTWGKYRLPIWSDGSPAFSMEPTAGPHDLAAYQAAGFAIIGEYSSAAAPPGGQAWAEATAGFQVESWDGADGAALLHQAHGIVMAAFAKAAFFTPIPEAAFVAAAEPLLQRADRRLILRVRDGDGRVVGMTFAFADPLRAGAVVMKTIAGLVPGAGRVMLDRIHRTAADMGAREVIHALMRRGIASESLSRKFGGRTIRRYALLGRLL